jgi:RecB family endonuclease NucS
MLGIIMTLHVKVSTRCLNEYEGRATSKLYDSASLAAKVDSLFWKHADFAKKQIDSL